MYKLTVLAVLLMLFLPTSVLTIFGDSTKSIPVEDVQKAVDIGNRTWIKAFETMDAALLASAFAPDGAMLNAGGAYIEGREAIEKRMAPRMKKMGPTKTTVETTSLWVIGDEAYESGKYSYTFQAKGAAKETIAEGRYVVIWRKQPDGGWKIFRDMAVPK